MTGILATMTRDELEDMVLAHGGRFQHGDVKTTHRARGGRTTHLVLGEVLEDGRPIAESKKYRRARSHGAPVADPVPRYLPF